MTKRPRLLLADDHKLVLEGLRRVLDPEFQVVAEVEDGRALLRAAQQFRPDVILLDISMPLLNGIDALRWLGKLCPASKSIIVTMHSEPLYIVAAFREGASGFVLKRSNPNELRNAIWAVVGGGQYVSSDLGTDLAALLKKAHRLPVDKSLVLTARQREVLQLIAEGRANKEIAKILHISVKTVEFHRSRIARTLGTKNISGLTQFALDRGLVNE